MKLQDEIFVIKRLNCDERMPLVSVVIPLYNKQLYIKRAIESVLIQTTQDFEIIVVDDGSTDKSAEIVQNINDRRIRLIQQRNGGVSVARNRGIKEAKADLIAFLDADDEWLPDFINTVIELRQKFPDAGAYLTNYFHYINTNIESQKKIYGIPTQACFGILHSYFESATKGADPITSSNVLIPKQIFDIVGKFPVDESWGEDSDMWGRIALRYPIAYSGKKCSIYHAEIRNKNFIKHEAIEHHPFVKTANLAMSNNEVPLEMCSHLKEYMAKRQLETAFRNLLASRPDLARTNIKECETHIYNKKKYWILFWTYIPSKIFLLLRSWKTKIE
ncbi:glycosyltransferase family 2 protein [Methanolobus halotolerans]|uniref:Glycosyltransferase family 2 protein n=1 Tax=Methanolobus halotolerans TaxID=2052935 RepID=A0A4E0PVG0_9EURY|nr:glycosyltransferase family A protein [Methanolobus halotolerans]TGC08027.1 glycosyltransferase family 2 protein [Methanolobus halotolerans]